VPPIQPHSSGGAGSGGVVVGGFHCRRSRGNRAVFGSGEVVMVGRGSLRRDGGSRILGCQGGVSRDPMFSSEE